MKQGLFLFIIAFLFLENGSLAITRVTRAQEEQRAKTTSSECIQFTCRIIRGKELVHPLGHSLFFNLVPIDNGWEIVISDTTRPEENLTRLTPPFHGPPNPRYIEGWHFRNEDNTAPNRGEINAPGNLREFYFSPLVGITYHYPPSPATLDSLMKEGRGKVSIRSMHLGNLIRDRHAWIDSMECAVEIEMGSHDAPLQSVIARWQSLLDLLVRGEVKEFTARATATGIASLFNSLQTGETEQTRMQRFGTIWNAWPAHWKKIDSTTIHLYIGPEVKAHRIEFRNQNGAWLFHRWTPGE